MPEININGFIIDNINKISKKIILIQKKTYY